ncbi:MAG: class I SAM-dependent methyltransferase [Rhizobiaceae bacterium]
MDKNLPEMATFKELEQSGWQAKAEGYDKFVGNVTTQAIGFVLDAAEVTQGKHVLDVASGPGYGVGGAVSRGATAIGLDFAASMVELAARNFPEAEFCEGDGENLSFADKSFDAVICLFGLLHMPEPEKAIVEAYRVLKSNGRYAFTVWDTPENHEFFAVVMNAIQTYGDIDVPLPPAPPMFRFSDRNECKKALTDAKFVDANAQSIPLVWRGSSGQECLNLIYNGTVRTAMLLEHQTPEALENIHRAIIEGAEKFKNADGIELAWPAILASATKS